MSMNLPDFMSYSNKFTNSDFVEKISRIAKRAGAKLVYAALVLYYTLQSDKISVKDNETSEEELSPVLYLTAPSGMNFYIDEGTDSIVLTAAGNYVLHILVSDGAGNMAMLNMRFSVV